MDPADISSMGFEQIQQWMVARGERAFRGRQLFRWLHQKCARSFEEMTDISKELRARLQEIVPLQPPRIVEELKAADGTGKLRFRLADGCEVEGVFIPDRRRRTLCLSTQVGCAMGCTFCATASMGLVRSLTAGEILGQMEAVVRHLGEEVGSRPVTNVVFMGMGEPLANLEAVITAVEVLLHPLGHGLSRRHVTVSTAGIPPAMEEFARRVPAKLAVSLNATSDEVRSQIMPINRRFPIGRLMDCCRNLPLGHTDRVTFEYVLLGGLNDRAEDARRLLALLRGIRSKVNLIPFNSWPGCPFRSPRPEDLERFLGILTSGAVSAFVRRSRGDSLQGACGQLVTGSGKARGGPVA